MNEDADIEWSVGPSAIEDEIKSLRYRIDFQHKWIVSMIKQINKLSHAAEIEWEDDE